MDYITNKSRFLANHLCNYLLYYILFILLQMGRFPMAVYMIKNYRHHKDNGIICKSFRHFLPFISPKLHRTFQYVRSYL